MAIQISPSILSADFANLADQCQAVAGHADWLHVDVMDNHFVPNLTIGLPVVEALLKTVETPVDCHLMIEDPDRWAPGYAEAGAGSVTFHVEAATAPIKLARDLRRHGARAGLGLRPATPVLDTDRIGDAARLIAAAERPMIVIGGGAADAARPLLELAEAIQAPVVSFRSGRGVVSDRHYLAQVLPAGHELWKTADLVIGIGTRMEQQLLHWRTTPGMKVIRIDIDANEFDRIQPPAVAIHGDARDAIEALLPVLRRHARRRVSREQELRQLKGRIAARIASVQPQMAYLRAIREALSDDGFFVDEITQVGYASWYGFPVYAPRHHVNTGYQGTLGFGYATALGVKIANPDCAVVNIAGDGGFLFTSNEMATAAQYNLPRVTVLFNNNRFLNVQRQQNDWFGGRRIGSDLKNPDFIRYAESFGIHAQRVATPEALVTAIRAGLERNAPALIEVPCGDMTTPWPHIILPPVGGAQRWRGRERPDFFAGWCAAGSCPQSRGPDTGAVPTGKEFARRRRRADQALGQRVPSRAVARGTGGLPRRRSHPRLLPGRRADPAAHGDRRHLRSGR